MSSTLTPEAPQQTAPHRPRRTWLIVLVALLVVVGIGVGTWAIIQANQSDDLAVATEFADAGDIAWTTGDGEAWAALFTEDGIWKEDSGVTYEGRDAISAWLVAHRFPLGLRVTAEKLPAVLYLDDRAVRFRGRFDEIVNFVKANASRIPSGSLG